MKRKFIGNNYSFPLFYLGGGRLRSLKIPNTEIAVCPISLRMSSRCSTTSGRLKISEVFSDGYEVLGSFLVAPFPYFDANLVQISPQKCMCQCRFCVICYRDFCSPFSQALLTWLMPKILPKIWNVALWHSGMRGWSSPASENLSFLNSNLNLKSKKTRVERSGKMHTKEYFREIYYFQP